MKKVLFILLILIFSIVAAFATISGKEEQLILSAVVKTGGVIDPQNIITPEISTAEGIYGYHITFGDNNTFAQNSKISIPEAKPSNLNIEKAGDYSFTLWYYGREEKNSQHVIGLTTTDWVLDSVKINATENQKVAMKPVVTTAVSSNVSSVVNTSPAPGQLQTVFGSNGDFTAVPNSEPVKVGTYKISWDGKTGLEVGNYNATLTFAIVGV